MDEDPQGHTHEPSLCSYYVSDDSELPADVIVRHETIKWKIPAPALEVYGDPSKRRWCNSRITYLPDRRRLVFVLVPESFRRSTYIRYYVPRFGITLRLASV